nr:hypothetical protein [Tanacetum cinerariifolium]
MDVKSAFLYGTIDEELSSNTPMDKENPWGKDGTGKDVDLHLYRSMIGSLMYLTASRPDIMFTVCACAKHQVTPKECHLHAAKRIFRYLKGHPKLGLWYPKDYPFDLVAYSDSDYSGATQDRKSTSRGCQFLGRRLISWQCKKQTIDKYVADILRKFGLIDGKSASTPIDTEKPLLKNPDGEDVDKVNDVTRLEALVDKKMVIITKATIRDALRLADAEGIDCLPNEEIFTELARMGYEKPSIKLTFYKAFFSKRTSWNEFSSSMASAVICLSTYRKFNFSKYIFDNLVRNVDSPTKFYMYPRFLQLMIMGQVGDLSSHTTKYSSLALTQKVFANMRRVGKGCSGVETPLFEGMLVAQQVDESTAELNDDDDVYDAGVADEGAAEVNVDAVPAAVDEPSIPSPTPSTQPPPPSQDIPSTSQDKISQALEITKLKQRVKKLKRMNKLKERMIADMDADVDVTLKDIAKDIVVDAETKESEDVQGRQTDTARRRKGVVIGDLEETVTPSTIIHTEAKSKDKGKRILVEEPKPLKKQAQIKQDEAAYDRELEAELNKNIDWDEVIYHVQRKEKEDNAVKRNVAGFKMDYFKGMTYEDIRPIFEKKFNSNVAFLQKTKEQIEEEDSRALKRTDGTTILPKDTNVSAFLAFGDSFVDQGNNNYVTTLAKADVPPYEKDFMGGKPTGRFSNGKTVADLLGSQPTINGYTAPRVAAIIPSIGSRPGPYTYSQHWAPAQYNGYTAPQSSGYWPDN